MIKGNEVLRKDIQDAIKWEPTLHAAEIGVTVKDGIVTLSGTVDSYSKKQEAESAAKSVKGVKAIVENIKIEFGEWHKKTDSELALEAVTALEANWEVPKEKVEIKVEDGWVTLSGTLHWNFERVAAKESVARLVGVKGVFNKIQINPASKDKIEQKSIERALEWNGSLDDAEIQVSVKGDDVTLSGMVDSWYSKDEAERIAWKTPGVRSVSNELFIEYTD